MEIETLQKNTKSKKAAEDVSTSNGMESPIYNITGKSVGKINLPENIFGISWNGDLVHQVQLLIPKLVEK